eukprot:4394345-Heterocapsa_arctica.AAC.1
MYTRTVGVDTANGRRRRTTIADKRRKHSVRRAARLQQLRKAGGKVTSINRSGATAVALWGLAGIGLPPGKLHSLRLSTLKSHTRMAKGTSVGIKLRATSQGRKFDPARIHHGDV